MDLSGILLCKPVLRRTRELRLGNIPDDQLDDWLADLRYPMPLLETFKATECGEDDLMVTLPEELFAHNAPVLRSVSLTGIATPSNWTYALFSPNLVHLSVGFTIETTPWTDTLDYAPTSQSFYAAISGMRALRSLTLRDVFPALPGNSDPPIELSVNLPALREVTLTASGDFVERCADFFSHLALPAHARAILELKAGGDFDFNERLPIHITKLFGPADTATPFTMYLSQTDVAMTYSYECPSVLLQRPIPHSPARDWAENNLGSGARALWTDHHDVNYIVLPHIPLLPLRTQQTIVFTPDFCESAGLVTPEAWVNTFGSASNVQNISIHYYDALVFFDALGENSFAGSSSPSLLFPRLSTMALHADFEEGSTAQIPRVEEARKSLDVLLVDLLQVRKEKGAPVQTLLVSRVLEGRDVWGRVEDLAHVEFF